MSVTLEIDGLEKWFAVADGERLLKEIDLEMKQSSQDLRDMGKQMPPVSARRTGYAALGIPVDTGLTRQKLVSRKNASLDYSDVAETDYSGHVHDGTSRMPARPFWFWLLKNFGGLETVEQNLTRALRKFTSP